MRRLIFAYKNTSALVSHRLAILVIAGALTATPQISQADVVFTGKKRGSFGGSYLYLGYGGVGTLTISGEDDEGVKEDKTIVGDLNLGYRSSIDSGIARGELNVLDGAHVTVNRDIALGHYFHSTPTPAEGGRILVSGKGSILSTLSQLDFRYGTSVLTVANGGTFSAPYWIRFGDAVGMGKYSRFSLNIGAAKDEAAQAPGILDIPSIYFRYAKSELNFNHTDDAYIFDVDIGSVLASAGSNHTINHLAGTTIWTGGVGTFFGYSQRFAGTTNITGGALIVNGELPGQIKLTGGALGGTGTVGNVEATDGTLSPGQKGTGSLTIGGNLVLGESTKLAFGLGAPDGTSGVDSDLITVGGDLTLDGTIDVTDAGAFGAGVYSLITYGGTLTDNGLTLGLSPLGYDYALSTTATPGTVSLLASEQDLLFWNGTSAADGTVHGGTGTWNTTSQNWTNSASFTDLAYDPNSSLVFQGTGGTVTVDSVGISVSSGLQFAADGYQVTGGDLNLNGATSVRVGEGSNAGADFSATIASDIRGAGSLNKTDLGTLILNGNNSYSGGTTLTAGKLLVNGSIGDVTVHGGSLGGSGAVRAAALNSGAVVTPGNSIGTLNAASLVFNSGSTYEVELNDGGDVAGTNNDLLAASGAATINGGTVHVKPENETDNGSTYTAGTVYTIISAAGGVSGTFDGSTPTDDFAFLDFELSYDANSVYLGSKSVSSTFCLDGMSANQCATGEGVYSTGSGSLFAATQNLSNAAAPTALDQLSGEAHASMKTALIEDSHFTREAVLNRMRTVLDADADSDQQQATKHVSDSLTFWGQGFGAFGSWEHSHNAAGMDRKTAGFLLGGDVSIAESSRIGMFGGYSNSNMDIDGRSSFASLGALHLGAYGATELGPVGLRAGASYTWHDIDKTRSVTFTGLAETLSGSYTAQTAQLFGEAGYRFDFGVSSLEPFANLTYLHLTSGAYSEVGGTAALTAVQQGMDNTFTSIGLRATTEVNFGNATADLFAQAAWQHTFSTITPTARHAFATGDAFSVSGVPVSKDTFLLNMGISAELGENSTLSVLYDGRFASGFIDQGLKATLALRF
ncbi:autotransporter outer membrane beta-barrel domain-containing protein [Polycladidibacter hongkongensis]|uniref:autotransporter outer membrane beta-barrel domain-containing protein n=1 Tax=Polycladidibacter hongkongensis TaxID=1647556 RepID=UPI000B024177|nr:autotransporter domain-containing protein [Pseudovibrio hongkongensis]